MNQIKEAMAEINRMAEFYKTFSDAEATLALIGNMESERVTLEGKVASLRADVDALNVAKDEVSAEVGKLKVLLSDKKKEALAKADAFLAAEMAKAQEAIDLKGVQLDAAATALAVMQDTRSAVEGAMLAEKAKAQDELDAIRVLIEAETGKLSDIRGQIAALKASL